MKLGHGIGISGVVSSANGIRLDASTIATTPIPARLYSTDPGMLSASSLERRRWNRHSPTPHVGPISARRNPHGDSARGVQNAVGVARAVIPAPADARNQVVREAPVHIRAVGRQQTQPIFVVAR